MVIVIYKYYNIKYICNYRLYYSAILYYIYNSNYICIYTINIYIDIKPLSCFSHNDTAFLNDINNNLYMMLNFYILLSPQKVYLYNVLLMNLVIG